MDLPHTACGFQGHHARDIQTEDCLEEILKFGDRVLPKSPYAEGLVTRSVLLEAGGIFGR